MTQKNDFCIKLNVLHTDGTASITCSTTVEQTNWS